MKFGGWSCFLQKLPFGHRISGPGWFFFFAEVFYFYFYLFFSLNSGWSFFFSFFFFFKNFHAPLGYQMVRPWKKRIPLYSKLNRSDTLIKTLLIFQPIDTEGHDNIRGFYAISHGKCHGKRYSHILYGINSISIIRYCTPEDSISQITR